MKIGIIGTGAVGGYYGALLAKSGFDVHFLLHSDYGHVRENGLFIDSINGDFTLHPVSAYAASADMPHCDILIVALKTTHNHLLKQILPDTLKPDGIIVVLQNGYGIEADLQEIMPSATIIGGLCFLCSNKVGPGHIRHLDYGSIRIGQHGHHGRPAGATEKLKTIADMFAKAAIPVDVAEDLGKARWEKLVWNMGFNGTTVVLNATTDAIMQDTSARRLVREIMLEVIAGARACGYDIDEQFSEKMLHATEKMVDYSPSMKLDYANGRKLEIENIYWRPIRAAETQGFDMRQSRTLAYQLDFLDHKNRMYF